MVRIGGQPLGFGKTRLSTAQWVVLRLQVSAPLISQFFFVDECGIVAQISQPLAESDISAYYISTFSFDHALVSLPVTVALEVNKNKSHTLEHFCMQYVCMYVVF